MPSTPTASGGTVTKSVGQSTALTSLFNYSDADGDIVSFAVKDREIGGGYLMKDGVRQAENTLFDPIPIGEISRWAFVAGPAGTTSTIGFQANDSRGAYNNPAAIATVNVAATADTIAPTLSSFTPTDNSTGVAVGANLVLNFNEAVRAGTGNIVIYNSSGTAVRTILATDTSQVSFSGSQMTINPASDLAAGTGYYVQMAAGVIRDIAGNNYAGITNTTAFNFTTASGIADNAGNTFATATARAVVGTSTGSVGIGADTDDFFKFVATANGRVTANLTGLSADIDLRALNSTGGQIIAGVASSVTSEAFSFNVVAGQTYYLRVDPYGAVSSNYSLATSFVPTVTSGWSKPIAITQSPLAGVPISVNQGYMGATSHHSNHGQHSIDLQAAVGTDVLSVVSGVIFTTGGSASESTGIFMTLKGDNGLYVSYFHLKEILVTSGRVSMGEHIAESGSTGIYNGQPIPPHLHIQFGDRLSDSGNVAWSSSLTNGIPAAFLASFFSGANSGETAGLVNVLNSLEIKGSDIFGTAAASLIDGTRDDDRMSGSGFGERMFGGGGHDVLNGLGGNDTLVGGSGNDRLWGGTGSDTFVFRAGHGNDWVNDFENGSDKLWIRGLAIGILDISISSVQSAGSTTVSDTLIKYGADSILLVDINSSLIEASDFLFI